jgi:TRAP-type C4-dicarboxylate transport system permease small subunit
MFVVYAALVVGFALAVFRGIQTIIALLRKNAEAQTINTGRM